MAGKVLHHVVDGFEHRHFVALHGEMLREPIRRERFDDARGFRDDAAQMLRQAGRREAAPGSKFRVALADIRPPAHRRNHPLPYVSAQMQYQIAHRVFTFRAARPDLLLSKAAQAVFDAAAKLPKLAGGVIEKQAIGGVHTKPGYTLSKTYGS